MPFAVPTFLGAFLLFVVEPMLAKWLLPTLGGNPATWSVCLVSFQALLLAGYAYAHLGARRLSPRRQARVHLVVLAGGALAVVLAGSAAAPSLGSLPPAISIPWLILGRIGMPYLVLASTTPLLTRWAAGARRTQVHSLYAVSNAGALGGLFAYPFVVERLFDVRVQLTGWALGFLLFASTMAWAARTVQRAPEGPPLDAPLDPGHLSTAGQRPRWLAYAFVPSAMLLAATNHITVDVAATPLLWVVPLALYLVSFIVAFGGSGSSFRGVVLPLWILGALGVAMNAYSQGATTLPRQLGATLLALFAASVLCHGELANERPPETELTGYYLTIALGGALGGAFVTFVAPLLFADFYELEITAIATFLLLLVAARPSARTPWARPQRLGLWLGCGLCLPLLASSVLVRLEATARDGRIVERRRSFLGPLRVVDVPEGRLLTHGRIQHGMQLAGAARRTPTMYFGPGTGLERVMRAFHADRPRQIGIVGLGVGTIAAYGRAGDTLRFYELDANVLDIARRDFTFLADSAARLDVVVGDGRLSLGREPPGSFDVLVLDAFSSDSVPVHLLTREAFALYMARLARDGLLLANVSNRFLSVDRVVRAGARAVGLACRFVETETDRSRHVTHVEWALLARDPEALAALIDAPPALSASSASSAPEVLWTDAHASVLSILR